MNTVFKGLAVAAGLAICAGAQPAQAATVTPAGVKNLEVVFAGGSKFYDVAFGDGSCIALFNGCDEDSDFPFSMADLGIAMQALTDALNVSSTLLSGFRPDGCSHGAGCFVYTPSEIPVGGEATATYMLGSIFFDWVISGTASFPSNFDSSILPASTFATWTEVAPIPLPASGILMAAGLGGLAALRRFRRKGA